jgi:hypothetical protein
LGKEDDNTTAITTKTAAKEIQDAVNDANAATKMVLGAFVI